MGAYLRLGIGDTQTYTNVKQHLSALKERRRVSLLLLYAPTYPSLPLAPPIFSAPMDSVLGHNADPTGSPTFGSEGETDRDLAIGLADAQLSQSRRRMLDLVNRLHSTG